MGLGIEVIGIRLARKHPFFDTYSLITSEYNLRDYSESQYLKCYNKER